MNDIITLQWIQIVLIILVVAIAFFGSEIFGFAEIFKYVGSTVAIVLGILKILEYLKNKPILQIRKADCFYDYLDEEKTVIDMKIELANVGKKPDTVKEITVNILDEDEKQLDSSLFSRTFNISKRLESGDYFDIPIKYTYDVKLPEKHYSLVIAILTTHGEYTRKVPMTFMYLSLSEVQAIVRGRMRTWVEENK